MKASTVYLTPVLALLLIFHLNPADAVADIITKTWTYEIIFTSGSFVEGVTEYNVGQIGHFTATYDDDSIIAHVFTDGPDSIPFNEDDVIDYSITNSGFMVSDITNVEWDLDDAFNDYLTNVRFEHDIGNDKTIGFDDLVIMSDVSIGFNDDPYEPVNDYFSHWEMSIDDFIGGNFNLYYDNGVYLDADNNEWVSFRRDEIRGVITSMDGGSDMEPVPEPATMLLFGTGLAGLAGYRKRKAMKK